MKKLLFLFAVLNIQLIQAQLQDCSQCHIQNYSESDLEKNTLGEIQLLRNEIFARHGYIFKKQRLNEFFAEKNWYQPKEKSITNISLNEIESHNMTIFRSIEDKIKSYRENVIVALKEFQRAVTNHDEESLAVYLNDVVNEGETAANVEMMDRLFDHINLDHVHWHHDVGYYKATIDNGFKVQVYTLRITNEKTLISYNNQSHSEIMEKPFTYPSDYYSEQEHFIQWELKFENGVVFLTNVMQAG
ncbi:MAG: YARHG domain-containing protein [Flavobacteriaceae bacterium]|nr:YARHG domain-containing protein [Flavobacteriaceae bacterium]